MIRDVDQRQMTIFGEGAVNGSETVCYDGMCCPEELTGYSDWSSTK